MSKKYEVIKNIIIALEGYLKGQDEITSTKNKMISIAQNMFNTTESDAQALIDVAYSHIDDRFGGKLAVAWIEDFESIKDYESFDPDEIKAMKAAIMILSDPSSIHKLYMAQEKPEQTYQPTTTEDTMLTLFDAPAEVHDEIETLEVSEEDVSEVNIEPEAETKSEIESEQKDEPEDLTEDIPDDIKKKLNEAIANLEKAGAIEHKNEVENKTEETEVKEEVEPDNSGSFPETEDGLRGYPKCYHPIDSGMLGLKGTYAINLRKVCVFDQHTGEFIYGEKGEDGRYYVTLEGNQYPLININTAIIPFGRKAERTKSAETTPARKVEDDSTSKTSSESTEILGTFKIPEKYNLERHYTVTVKDVRHATAECIETGETFEAKVTSNHMFLHFKIEGKYIDVDWLLKEYGIITNEMKQLESNNDTENIDEYGRRYVWIDFIPNIPKKKYYITDSGVVINYIDEKPLSLGKAGYRFSPTTCKSGEANGSIQPPSTNMCRRKLLAIIRDKHPGFLNVTE